MKNGKRILVLLLSLAMVFATTVSASAVENTAKMEGIGEIRSEANVTTAHKAVMLDKELLSASSEQEVISILHERKISEAKNLSDAEINNILAQYNTTRSSDNENYVVSKTTVLAYLCTSDGISAANLLTANSVSDDASALAAAKYPNDVSGLQDSYRHFIWNHMLTEELSKTKARTITCNYEWQAYVLPYAEDMYYDLTMEYLMYPNLTAAAIVILAFDGAMEYALELRDVSIALCEADFSYFQDVFEDANIRDFWNNCYGRAYAADYSYSYSTAFSVANANGELINADDDVTYNNTYNVWSWDWYTP